MTTERMLDQEERGAGVASLAKRLRAIAGPETPLRSYVADLMRDAADALEAVERERDGVVEECARAVEAFARHYPTSVFIPPPPGQHGATVDGCSAAAIRAVLPGVAAEVRRLARTPEGGTDG